MFRLASSKHGDSCTGRHCRPTTNVKYVASGAKLLAKLEQRPAEFIYFFFFLFFFSGLKRGYLRAGLSRKRETFQSTIERSSKGHSLAGLIDRSRELLRDESMENILRRLFFFLYLFFSSFSFKSSRLCYRRALPREQNN